MVYLIQFTSLCYGQSASIIYKDGTYTFSKGINKGAASYGTFKDKISSSGYVYEV